MSEALTAKVLIIGGGPGATSPPSAPASLAWIRFCGSGSPGRTCLIRGCIPSKALIHAASQFDAMVRTAAGAGELGIGLATGPTLDLARTIQWKTAVVDKLNAGVESLLKRAKVKVVAGLGDVFRRQTCQVGRTRAPHHPRRARRPRQRFRCRWKSPPSLRRPGDLLHRGP